MQDNITRSKINTILEKNKQLRSFEIEVSALKAAITNQGDQVRKYRDSNTELQKELMECVEKKAGQRTWATIGKVFVIGGTVAVIGGAAALYLSR